MDSPEERARVNIDRLLTAAGWEVQDRRRANLRAVVGVAVRGAETTALRKLATNWRSLVEASTRSL